MSCFSFLMIQSFSYILKLNHSNLHLHHHSNCPLVDFNNRHSYYRYNHTNLDYCTIGTLMCYSMSIGYFSCNHFNIDFITTIAVIAFSFLILIPNQSFLLASS